MIISKKIFNDDIYELSFSGVDLSQVEIAKLGELGQVGCSFSWATTLSVEDQEPENQEDSSEQEEDDDYNQNDCEGLVLSIPEGESFSRSELSWWKFHKDILILWSINIKFD